MQPWSMDIVEGNMKYLIRSFNSYIKGRIGILSTRSIDKIWYRNAQLNRQEIKIHPKSQIIGSVILTKVIQVKSNEVIVKLKELGGNDYLKYYPNHLIPSIDKNKNLYIWIFKNAKKWRKPIQLSQKFGMQWCKLEIKDEE